MWSLTQTKKWKREDEQLYLLDAMVLEKSIELQGFQSQPERQSQLLKKKTNEKYPHIPWLFYCLVTVVKPHHELTGCWGGEYRLE